MQTATQQAVTAIKRITATIEEMSAIAATIATAVARQRKSTAEIARIVEQTAEASRHARREIEDVSSMATEPGSNAGRVLGATATVSQQMQQLAVDVRRFVEEIRAA